MYIRITYNSKRASSSITRTFVSENEHSITFASYECVSKISTLRQTGRRHKVSHYLISISSRLVVQAASHDCLRVYIFSKNVFLCVRKNALSGWSMESTNMFFATFPFHHSWSCLSPSFLLQLTDLKSFLCVLCTYIRTSNF